MEKSEDAFQRFFRIRYAGKSCWTNGLYEILRFLEEEKIEQKKKNAVIIWFHSA